MNDATQPQPEPKQTAQPEADPLRDLQERLAPQIEQATEKLAEVNEQVKDFIRKNPGTTLLGAVAVGFLVGRWASRR